MEDVHGKEISLQYTTVKVPGMKPRGSKVVPGSGGSDPLSAEMHTLNIASVGTPGPPLTGRSSLGGPLQSNKDKVREIFVLSFCFPGVRTRGERGWMLCMVDVW